MSGIELSGEYFESNVRNLTFAGDLPVVYNLSGYEVGGTSFRKLVNLTNSNPINVTVDIYDWAGNVWSGSLPPSHDWTY